MAEEARRLMGMEKWRGSILLLSPGWGEPSQLPGGDCLVTAGSLGGELMEKRSSEVGVRSRWFSEDEVRLGAEDCLEEKALRLGREEGREGRMAGR